MMVKVAPGPSLSPCSAQRLRYSSQALSTMREPMTDKKCKSSWAAGHEEGGREKKAARAHQWGGERQRQRHSTRLWQGNQQLVARGPASSLGAHSSTTAVPTCCPLVGEIQVHDALVVGLPLIPSNEEPEPDQEGKARINS
jgi:hypothetical protein